MTSIAHRTGPGSPLTMLAGGVAAAFGAVHVAAASAGRRDTVSRVAAEGWWDTVTLGPATTPAELGRSEAFWATLGSFGAPMLVLGSSIVWSARQRHRVPGWLGWSLLGWGLPVVTVLPRSPGWVIPLVGGLLVLGDRQREDSGAGERDADGLPFVDRHRVLIDAPAPAVWQALPTALPTSRHRPTAAYARVVGADPATSSGGGITEATPNRRVRLTGQHRFSRYALTFTLETMPGGTSLLADTHADFPGPFGRVYRALVIGSGAHAVLVPRMLRSVRRRAERPRPA